GPGGLVEREAGEELPPHLPVRGAALGVAERGDLQPLAGQPQRPERLVGDGDHLGVEGRVVDADRLDADLLQLAVAARLRALVAEERARVAQLDRQPVPVEPVLDDCPDDARRALRPQRHRPLAAVGEGVHLLGDHVGGLADPARVQRGVLEHRQLQQPVAGAVGGGLERGADGGEPRRLRRVVLRDALGRGERGDLLLLHGGHRPRPRTGAPSPCRNGLDARSRPTVVVGPWPGSTTVSSGLVSSLSRRLASSCWWSPPGRSVRPIDPAKSVSPASTTSTPSSVGVLNTTEPGVWPGVWSTRSVRPASSRAAPSASSRTSRGSRTSSRPPKNATASGESPFSGSESISRSSGWIQAGTSLPPQTGPRIGSGPC